MHASRVLNKKIIEFELNPALVYDALLTAWKEYGFDGFEVPVSHPNGWIEQLEAQILIGVMGGRKILVD